MARQEFNIRITRKGKIILEIDGMPIRQVKDLVQFFEERLGPARVSEGDDGGATGGVEIDEDLAREYEDEQEEQSRRLRLRPEGE